MGGLKHTKAARRNSEGNKRALINYMEKVRLKDGNKYYCSLGNFGRLDCGSHVDVKLYISRGSLNNMNSAGKTVVYHIIFKSIFLFSLWSPLISISTEPTLLAYLSLLALSICKHPRFPRFLLCASI